MNPSTDKLESASQCTDTRYDHHEYNVPLPACDGKTFNEILGLIAPAYNKGSFEVDKVVNFTEGATSGSISFKRQEGFALIFEIVSGDKNYTFKFAVNIAGLFSCDLSEGDTQVQNIDGFYPLLGIALQALLGSKKAATRGDTADRGNLPLSSSASVEVPRIGKITDQCLTLDSKAAEAVLKFNNHTDLGRVKFDGASVAIRLNEWDSRGLHFWGRIESGNAYLYLLNKRMEIVTDISTILEYVGILRDFLFPLSAEPTSVSIDEVREGAHVLAKKAAEVKLNEEAPVASNPEPTPPTTFQMDLSKSAVKALKIGKDDTVSIYLNGVVLLVKRIGPGTNSSDKRISVKVVKNPSNLPPEQIQEAFLLYAQRAASRQ